MQLQSETQRASKQTERSLCLTNAVGLTMFDEEAMLVQRMSTNSSSFGLLFSSVGGNIGPTNMSRLAAA